MVFAQRRSPKVRRRRKLLCYAAQVALRAIVDEGGHIAPEMLEATAEGMRELAKMGLFPEPERWAVALEVVLWPEAHAPCGSVTVFGELIVRTSADGRRYCLSVLHELAHAKLRELDVDHGHGDVWRLTLALAVPRSELKRAAWKLRQESWVPGWAVDLRVAMGRG